jgi:hypothetical protein
MRYLGSLCLLLGVERDIDANVSVRPLSQFQILRPVELDLLLVSHAPALYGLQLQLLPLQLGLVGFAVLLGIHAGQHQGLGQVLLEEGDLGQGVGCVEG